MPVVLRHKGCRFFFSSNEGHPQEPLHIHVRRGESVAKIWLAPFTCLDESFGFNPSELRELLEVAEDNRERIERSWHEYFGH
jgi:hypothetical protein